MQRVSKYRKASLKGNNLPLFFPPLVRLAFEIRSILNSQVHFDAFESQIFISFWRVDVFSIYERRHWTNYYELQHELIGQVYLTARCQLKCVLHNFVPFRISTVSFIILQVMNSLACQGTMKGLQINLFSKKLLTLYLYQLKK